MKSKLLLASCFLGSSLFAADFQLEQICDGSGALTASETEIAKKFPIGDCNALSKSRGGELDGVDAIQDGAGTVVVSPLGQRKSTVIAKQKNTLYELAKEYGSKAKDAGTPLVSYIQDTENKVLSKEDFGVEDEGEEVAESNIDNTSCKTILATSEDAPADGIYEIDPDGDGGNSPFNAYCDMNVNGGGWTLVSSYRGQGPWFEKSYTQDYSSADRNFVNDLIDYRLPKSFMSNLQTENKVYLRMVNGGSWSNNYAVVNMDVLSFSGDEVGFTFSDGVIKGFPVNTSNLNYWWQVEDTYTLHYDAQRNGIPGATSSEDNFGYYWSTNPSVFSSSTVTQVFLR